MKYHCTIFKMAAEREKDVDETKICSSRNTLENEFFFLMEEVVMNPSQLSIIVEKLQSVISSLDCTSDLVNSTFEFYKNEHAFPTECLLIQLFSRGIVTDASILGKSYFRPFLHQLLFESVTESAVECAKYSTKLWIDRISKEDGSSTNLPNPLEYLDPNSPTHPSTIPNSVLLQFKFLDDKQRKFIILDLRKMTKLIPPRFYPRLIIAFMIFLEFYKEEKGREGGYLIPEISLWAETWHHLIMSSLTELKTEKGTKHLPLHHLLNGTMASSKAFEFILTIPDVLHNVLKSLRLFGNNSSGFMKKWVCYFLLKLEGSQVSVEEINKLDSQVAFLN